jgi:hypothetical protein
VSGLPERRGTARRVTGSVVRSQQLYRALRSFVLGAFRFLAAELEAGAELRFAFEGHGTPGRPTLYEYRPLVRQHLEARDWRLFGLEDAKIALEELRREPAAAIFARAHAAPRMSEDEALLRSVLLPMLADVAEACGGFDWDDTAFDHAYVALERSLYGEGHVYGAVAPLVGLELSATVELGDGVRVRHAAAGELDSHWPEAARLLPPGFGGEPDRLCVLEVERALERGSAEVPDAPGEVADAVTALRLAADGAIAAGPVLFERLDWRPYGVRPVLPIAATVPGGQPARLDAARGALARDLRERLVLADGDAELAEGLDRWELSLFQAEPFRSEQLREALSALLGGPDGVVTAALRAALLLGEPGHERGELASRLRALAAGGPGGPEVADAVRRALVEAVMHGERRRLVEALDDALLGLRSRPAGYYSSLVSRPLPRSA